MHGLLSNTNIRITIKKKNFGTPYRLHYDTFGRTRGVFSKVVMTSEGLGEMFEGDPAEKCGKQFPLMSIGCLVEGLACADQGVRA